MDIKLRDTFKETANNIAFLNRGKGLDAADVQGAIEQAYLKAQEIQVETVVRHLDLEPARLIDPQTITMDVNPIDFWGGYLWGRSSNKIYRSSDDGFTWEEFATMPFSDRPRRILPTSDGEVLIADRTRVYKSVGWPNNISWKLVLDVVDPEIRSWGFDGNGSKFIVTHYSNDRPKSRYAWISTDAGETWFPRYDAAELHGPEVNDGSHIHGVCYDPWQDMFFISEGHTDVRGVYYSNDDGLTWHKIPTEPDLDFSNAPTVLVATDKGIVCGSDATDAGVYHIERTEKPEDMIIRWDLRIYNEVAMIGFADRGYRDPRTGIVYIGWRTDTETFPPIITASNGRVAAIVHVFDDYPWQRYDRVDNVVVSNKFLYARLINDAGEVLRYFRATIPAGGVQSVTRMDTGKVLGGTVRGHQNIAYWKDSLAVGVGSEAYAHQGIAIGPRAKAGTMGQHWGAIALGVDALAGSGGAIAIGKETSATGGNVAIGRGIDGTKTNTTAIGQDVETSGSNDMIAIGNKTKVGTYSIVIGQQAEAGSSHSVVIGQRATSNNVRCTIIGSGAASTGTNDSIAIGYEAESGTHAIAIGNGAKATHTNSVAIGNGTVTTDRDRVHIGSRDLVIGESGQETVRGIYMRSPNGKQWFITVNDNGELEVSG